MLDKLKFWKKSKNGVGDLYERIGIMKEDIKTLKSMVSKHDKDAINEISTIRKNEERIQNN